MIRAICKLLRKRWLDVDQTGAVCFEVFDLVKREPVQNEGNYVTRDEIATIVAETVRKIMKFTMGNCITMEDTNGNRKLLKKRREQKINNVAAMMDAYVAFKLNKEVFE